MSVLVANNHAIGMAVALIQIRSQVSQSKVICCDILATRSRWYGREQPIAARVADTGIQKDRGSITVEKIHDDKRYDGNKKSKQQRNPFFR